MSTSYSDTVIEQVKTALEGIEISSGYNHDLRSVIRYDRYQGPDAAPPFAVLRVGTETKGQDGSEWNTSLQIRIDLTVYNDQASTDRSDELLADWKWDVERALVTQFPQSTEFNLIGLTSTPYDVENPEETDDGLIVLADFRYHVDYTDIQTLISPS